MPSGPVALLMLSSFKFFDMISFDMLMSSKRIRLLELVSRVGIEDVSSIVKTLAKWLFSISAFSRSYQISYQITIFV